jgi:hypothetical protein
MYSDIVQGGFRAQQLVIVGIHPRKGQSFDEGPRTEGQRQKLLEYQTIAEK